MLGLTGCRQKMVDTPRYEPYEVGAFFEDSLAMRPLVEGTVARNRLLRTPNMNPYYTDGTFVGTVGASPSLTDRFPFEITRRVLERGQQQFNIYCAPCHGRTGHGHGMVVQRGLRHPPTFHSERLRAAPVGHFFNVITNGFGAMYSYAARIPPEDRWAIIAYLRALQLSQHAPFDDVPLDQRIALQP